MKHLEYAEVELDTAELEDKDFQAFLLANNITVDVVYTENMNVPLVNYSGKWIDLVAMLKSFWGPEELQDFVFQTQ